MTEPTMRDVLDRLEAQEKELAALRTARTRRTRLPGGRKSRILTLGIIALLVALVPLSILAATPFIDLTGGDHDADINSAYNLGLTNGCTPTEYCPTNNVTCQEMASFITRTGALSRIAFASRPTAAGTDDIGADAEKEYMMVTLDVPGRAGDSAVWVKVSFTGYVYARSSAPITGTPTLLRGEIRRDGETAGPAQIVTRSVVGSDPNAIVTVPATATAPASTAERLSFAGSRVFSLAPGTYKFRMVVRKDVGSTASDVGFGFGNMQAETIAFGSDGSRGTVAP